MQDGLNLSCRRLRDQFEPHGIMFNSAMLKVFDDTNDLALIAASNTADFIMIIL